jgi:hypothetical protein
VKSSATSAQLFVSNALGGNTTTDHGVPVTGDCTVVRLDLQLSATAPPVLTSSTVVGSGYPWRTTPIAATAVTLSAGGALDAPLGMTLAPNGDLVVVNGNNGNAVEITPAGQQLTTRTLVKNGAGDLFGVIATQTGNGIFVVNDGTNAIDLFRR